MRIAVAMKPVPDLLQIRMKDRRPVLEDVPVVLGAIDRSALEIAVELKEKTSGHIVVLMAGDGRLEDTVKEALAAGADEALLIRDARLNGADGSLSARALAAGVRKIGPFDLLLFGEGSTDNYSGQVMSRVSEILGIPQAGYVRDIVVEGETLVVTRSLEDEEEILEIRPPAAVSVLSEIREPRIPSVTAILKARKKPATVLSLDELGLGAAAGAGVETVSTLAPVTGRRGERIPSLEELVRVLRKEAPGGGT